MVFARQLSILLDTLEISGSELAAYVKIDRTGISRMKSGSRQPKPNGTSMRKLLHGIISYCAENGKTAILQELISEEGASEEELTQALKAWLYKDSAPEHTGNQVSSSGHASAYLFGSRLNAVMDLADISNIKLSRLVYADASLISRYRRSERYPKSRSNTARRICSVLWKRLEKSGRIDELCALMKSSKTDEHVFYTWLFEGTEETHTDTLGPEKMISLLNANIPVPQIDSQELSELPESDIQEIYYGTDGLRSAVVRLLRDAAEHQVQQMYLYSDESMDWLSGDPQYFRIWGSLMHLCIQNHTKITIIHYVKRNMKELNDAIAGWLPLYLSGMISSYFCQKNEHFPFTNTIFLIPGEACIRACHVQGFEAEGIYHYHTDGRSLLQFEKEYRSLITQTSPLFTIMPGIHMPEDKTQVMICNTLPLATMSKETALSFKDDRLYAAWEDIRYRFDETTDEKVIEFIPVKDTGPDRNDPVYTEALPDIPSHVYTEDQYHAHLEDIRKLAAENLDYEPVFLKQHPFDNVRIMITETSVSIIRTLPSPVTFKTSHPKLHQAFMDYVLLLKDSLI
ncbi:MAG: hypothetical protein IJH14_02720 [Solobacterium sp.]|nr:hypothetical protein [Solobacterium sp.]